MVIICLSCSSIMFILAEFAALRFEGSDAPGPLAPEVIGALLVLAAV